MQTRKRSRTSIFCAFIRSTKHLSRRLDMADPVSFFAVSGQVARAAPDNPRDAGAPVDPQPLRPPRSPPASARNSARHRLPQGAGKDLCGLVRQAQVRPRGRPEPGHDAPGGVIKSPALPQMDVVACAIAFFRSKPVVFQ